MLTSLERREVNIYGDKALNSVDAMKDLIAYFEDPIHEMGWCEFSRAMHRELLRYDESANKVEAIYRADFQRTFCDEEDE